MTNSDRYLADHYPDTYYVLGRRMQHFTLGHAMLLERLGSPFSVRQPEPAANAAGVAAALGGPGDLKLAIALCSRKYPAALKLLARPWRLRFALSRQHWTAEQTVSGALELLDYIRRSSGAPQTWEKAESREMGAPFLAVVKVV